MKKLLLLTFMVGCMKERAANEWRGVPEGTKVTCQNAGGNANLLVCVGSGRAYNCVRTQVSNETHAWYVFECARVSSPVMPEAPPSD